MLAKLKRILTAIIDVAVFVRSKGWASEKPGFRFPGPPAAPTMAAAFV